MRANTIQKEILFYLKLLERNQQADILRYIKSLAKGNGLSEKKIQRFSTFFDKESLDSMKKAIESDCEKTDYNEW